MLRICIVVSEECPCCARGRRLCSQLFTQLLDCLRCFVSQDAIYSSTATNDYTLVNGCTDFTIPVNTGEWTRLRMLKVAHEVSEHIQHLNVIPAKLH